MMDEVVIEKDEKPDCAVYTIRMLEQYTSVFGQRDAV